MSKQKSVFMLGLDYKDIFDYVTSINAKFIHTTGDTIYNYKELIIHTKCYIINNSIDTEALYKVSGHIDPCRSEVVEFCRSFEVPSQILDITPIKERFGNNGGLIIDDENEYDRIMADIKANPTYVDNPQFTEYAYNSGRFWTTLFYFDESYTKITKSKSLQQLWNKISRFISNNFRISERKDYYIGRTAYQEYLAGKYIPCSGNYMIKF